MKKRVICKKWTELYKLTVWIIFPEYVLSDIALKSLTDFFIILRPIWDLKLAFLVYFGAVNGSVFSRSSSVEMFREHYSLITKIALLKCGFAPCCHKSFENPYLTKLLDSSRNGQSPGIQSLCIYIFSKVKCLFSIVDSRKWSITLCTPVLVCSLQLNTRGRLYLLPF